MNEHLKELRDVVVKDTVKDDENDSRIGKLVYRFNSDNIEVYVRDMAGFIRLCEEEIVYEPNEKLKHLFAVLKEHQEKEVRILRSYLMKRKA